MGLLSGKNNKGLSKESVLEALKRVEDPDLHRDLVSLGMIKDVSLDGGKVSFTLELTTPACPMKEKMKQDCIEAVS
ncbi:MAG: iron-sulfur cluster assembly protein, partial [Candidatus Hinthialibacter sp.]